MFLLLISSKSAELIYIILGIIQHGIVLNTSVK